MNNLFSLKNKTIVITGAANGIGKTIFDELIREGCDVKGIDKDYKTENSNRILYDLSYGFNGDNVWQLQNIKIDGLVNCAGISISNNLFEYKDEDWDKTYNTNLKAPYELSKFVAKNMIENKINGSIINITSCNAYFGFSNNPAYVTFKGALASLTRSLAVDLGKYNIRVNNITPGYIHTNMTDKSFNDKVLSEQRISRTILNRWGETRDIIGAVIFLLSNASNYITGQDIIIDGGWSIKGI